MKNCIQNIQDKPKTKLTIRITFYSLVIAGMCFCGQSAQAQVSSDPAGRIEETGTWACNTDNNTGCATFTAFHCQDNVIDAYTLDYFTETNVPYATCRFGAFINPGGCDNKFTSVCAIRNLWKACNNGLPSSFQGHRYTTTKTCRLGMAVPAGGDVTN